nr:strawberry notch C-terminal domain-containing protein [Sphingobium sp. RAC03]
MAAGNIDAIGTGYAREALGQWYRLLFAGKLSSVTMGDFVTLTGLKLVDEGGNLLETLPPIQRWLNRILALRIAIQNAIFEEYIRAGAASGVADKVRNSDAASSFAFGRGGSNATARLGGCGNGGGDNKAGGSSRSGSARTRSSAASRLSTT